MTDIWLMQSKTDQVMPMVEKLVDKSLMPLIRRVILKRASQWLAEIEEQLADALPKDQ